MFGSTDNVCRISYLDTQGQSFQKKKKSKKVIIIFSVVHRDQRRDQASCALHLVANRQTAETLTTMILKYLDRKHEKIK